MESWRSRLQKRLDPDLNRGGVCRRASIIFELVGKSHFGKLPGRCVSSPDYRVPSADLRSKAPPRECIRYRSLRFAALALNLFSQCANRSPPFAVAGFHPARLLRLPVRIRHVVRRQHRQAASGSGQKSPAKRMRRHRTDACRISTTISQRKGYQRLRSARLLLALTIQGNQSKYRAFRACPSPGGESVTPSVHRANSRTVPRVSMIAALPCTCRWTRGGIRNGHKQVDALRSAARSRSAYQDSTPSIRERVTPVISSGFRRASLDLIGTDNRPAWGCGRLDGTYVQAIYRNHENVPLIRGLSFFATRPYRERDAVVSMALKIKPRYTHLG